jgi:hypothetical protein
MNPYQRHIPHPDVFELSHTPRASVPYEPKKGDVVDWPAIEVTEGELTPDAQALFCAAASKGMHVPTVSFPDAIGQASPTGAQS